MTNKEEPALPSGLWQPIPQHMQHHHPVWHYTDAWALESIVRTGELWATAATMLNDPQELTFGATRVTEWYAKRGETQAIAPGIRSLLDEQIEVLVDHVVDDPAFVVCASTRPDVLGVWLGYADSTGYAVQLDPFNTFGIRGAPVAGTLQAAPTWVKVRYKRASQDRLIQATIADLGNPKGMMARAFDLWGSDWVRPFVRQALFALAASMKHPVFRDEREVRMIAYRPQGISPSHRGTRRGIVPYLRVGRRHPLSSLIDGVEDPNTLPILEVRVGPPEGLGEGQRIRGAQSLLREAYGAVQVRSAGVPYLPA